MAVFALIFSLGVSAQVSIVPADQPTGTNTRVTTLGTTHFITGGEISGTNLFHAFQTFSLESGQTATWADTTGNASNISNIVNIVRGMTPSQINGRLNTLAYQNADVFFINPAGVIFGAEATVDVPKGFHVSTADSIEFADGFVMASDGSSGSQLSAANPIAFGFLGGVESGIEIQGSQFTGFSEASDVSFTGGEIEIGNGARVDVPSGRLLIAAVSEGGGLNFREYLGDYSQYQLGELRIAGGSRVFSDATGNSGGRAFLALIGDSITLTEDVQVTSDNITDIDGGQVFAWAMQDMRIGGGSVLRASALREGSVIGVNVSAGGQIVLDGSAATDVTGIVSSSQPRSSIGVGGNAGDVVIVANQLQVLNGAQIQTISNIRGGDSGAITISTGDLVVDGSNDVIGASTISNTLQQGSLGTAGNIVIQSENASISNGGTIQSSTRSQQAGGAISITIDNLLLIDGDEDNGATGLFSQSELDARGDAGSVIIRAGEMRILNGGDVSTETQSFGAPGDIEITLSGDLSISGSEGRSTGVFSQSGASAEGELGEISIVARNVALENFGAISAITAAETDAISSVDQFGRLSENPGQISLVLSGDLSMGSQSLISTDSRGSATSGEVSVRADGAITLSEGAQIASANSGQGRAGAVEITSGNDFSLSNSASITTDSDQSEAGDIFISLGEDAFLFLTDAEITTSGIRGVSDETTGGRIFVRSSTQQVDFGGVVLRNSLLEALGDGSGALLSIDQSGVLVKDLSSQIAVSGTVEAPETEIRDDQESVDVDFFDAGEALATQCPLRREGEGSALSYSAALALRTNQPPEPPRGGIAFYAKAKSANPNDTQTELKSGALNGC